MKRVVVLGLFILGVMYFKNKKEDQKKTIEQYAALEDILEQVPSGKTNFSEADFLGRVERA